MPTQKYVRVANFLPYMEFPTARQVAFADVSGDGAADGSETPGAANPTGPSDTTSAAPPSRKVPLPDYMETDVAIGLVTLPVPPTDISVRTVANSDVLTTLRSTTASLVKSGRSQIRIDMSCVFPDLNSVNRALRTLLAQFRLTPFIPLVSEYVYTAVAKELVSSVAEDASTETERVAALDSLRKANTKDVDKLSQDINSLAASIPQDATGKYAEKVHAAFVALIHSIKVSIDYWNDPSRGNKTDETAFLDSINATLLQLMNAVKFTQPGFPVGERTSDTAEVEAQRSFTLADGIVWLSENDPIIRRFANTISTVLETYSNIRGRLIKIAKLEEASGSDQGGGPTKSTLPGMVPVALHNISVSAIPDSPEALRVDITLLYFNYAPFSKDFTFLGKEGAPTYYATQCPWLENYINNFTSATREGYFVFGRAGKRWLKNIVAQNIGTIGFKFPTRALSLYSSFSDVDYGRNGEQDHVVVDDSAGGSRFVARYTTPVIRDASELYVNKYRELVYGPGSGVVVESVSATLGNRLSVLPILGSTYPTVQYLGGMNARAYISLIVTGDTTAEHNALIAQLTSMKREVEDVCIKYGPRARRDSKVFISDPILNLMGVHAIQMEDMTIQSIGPNSSRVTLSAIEFTASQSSREKLINTDSTKIAAKYKELINFLYSRSSRVTAEIPITEYPFHEPHNILYGNLPARLLAFSNKPNNLFFILRNDVEFLRLVEQVNRVKARETSVHALNQVDDDISNVNFGYPTLKHLIAEYQNISSRKLADATEGRVQPRESRIIAFRYLAAAAYGRYVDGNGTDASKEWIIKFRDSLVDELESDMIPDGFSIAQINAMPIPVVTYALLLDRRFIRFFDANRIFTANILDNISKLEDFVADYLYTWAKIEGHIDDVVLQAADGDYSTPTGTVFLDNMVKVITAMEKGEPIVVPGFEFYPFPGQDSLQLIYNAMRRTAKRAPSTFGKSLEVDDSLGQDSDNYADLFLPTYSEAYKDIWDNDPFTDITAAWEVNLDLLGGNPKQIAARFVPTYRALGVDPPEGKTKDSFARNLADKVEPGFFWYQYSMSEVKDTGTSRAQTQPSSSRTEGTPSVPPAVPIRNPNGEIDETERHRAVQQAIAAARLVGSTAAREVTRIADAVYSTIKDDVFAMRRAFPTFRLYFVEPQNESLSIVDDLYGYNSVLSIRLHRHVFHPDLLEVDLLNVSGTLDDIGMDVERSVKASTQELAFQSGIKGIYGDDSATSAIGRVKDGIRNLDSNALYDPVTGRKKNLGQLFLREGTGVVLKMGYTTKSDELKTVFTGQIAEVVRGDIIKLVCQNHGVELTVPVNAVKLNSTFDAVVEVMNDNAPLHFGVLEPAVSSTLDALRTRRAGGGPGTNKTGIPAVAIRTRRLDNIYISPDTNTWGIPNRTGLEFLHEVARHIPGAIAAVRPYDNNSTFFLGYPGSSYRYTDKGIEQDALGSGVQRVRTSSRPEEYPIPIDDRKEILQRVARLQQGFAGITALEDLTFGRGTPDNEYIEWLKGPLQEFKSLDWAHSLANPTIKADTSYIADWDTIVGRLGPDGSRELVRNLLNDLERVTTNLRLDYEYYGIDGKLRSGPVFLGFIVAAPTTFSGGNEVEDLERGSGDVSFRNMFRGIERLGSGGSSFYRVPGNQFTRLVDWDAKFRSLLGKLDTITGDDIVTHILSASPSVRTVDEAPISNWAVTAQHVAYMTAAIRGYVHNFATWLNRVGATEYPNLLANIASYIASTANVTLETGRRNFRAYHWVDSDHHLMKNNIRASVDQMANTVRIRYPESRDLEDAGGGYVIQKSDIKWKMTEVSFVSSLREQDRKVDLYTELNATTENRAQVTALNNLRDSIGRMYRGDIVMLGDPTIEPYDVLFIFDFYNLMFGPVEVEAVTHILMGDVGFASIVNPRALVFTGPDNDSDLVIAASKVANNLAEVTSGSLSSPLAFTVSDSDIAIYQNARIIPLVVNGRPWTAGLRSDEDRWFSIDVSDRMELYDAGKAVLERARIFGGG